MKISRAWVWLSATVAVLVAAASLVGLFTSAYARETPSWAAQGAGQDVANLIVAVPMLLAATYFAARGSAHALLVATGALLYVVYSYVLYSFFIHFGPPFPIYVATLSTSFFALVSGVRAIDVNRIAIDDAGSRKSASVFLAVVALLFGLLEGADVARALASGAAPASVAELGLPVNPVYVLDLAFVLPGAVLAAVVLWRGHRAAPVVAVPLLVFFALMGIAVVAMMVMMRARGLGAPLGILSIFAAVIAGCVYFSCAIRAKVLSRKTDAVHVM